MSVPLDHPREAAKTPIERLSLSHVVGLFIALVLSTLLWLPPVIGPLLPDNLFWRNIAAQGVDWAFAVTLILIVLFWERRSLASMGFKEFNSSILFAGLGLGGFVMIGTFAWSVISPMLFTSTGSVEGASASELPPGFYLWFAPFALITASFAEEIIYRGYAMERLLRLGVGPIVTVIVTQIAFALYHLKDGMSSVIGVATIGSLFALYYVWTRNLWVTIIGHFFVDAMAIVGHVFNIRPNF